MNEQRHIIQRQVLEIQLARQKDAPAIQQRVSELYHQRLRPLLASVFDKMIPVDQHIRLERLEIDLGKVSPDYLEIELAAALPERVIEILKVEISQSTVSDPDHAMGQSAQRFQPEGKSLSAAASQWELITAFLLSGRLPWWAGSATAQPLEKIFLDFCKTKSGIATDMLKKLFCDERVIKRLVRQFSPAAYKQTIKLLFPAHSSVIARLIEAWVNFSQAELSGKAEEAATTIRTAILTVLQKQSLPDTPLSEIALIQGVIEILIQEQGLSQNQLKEKIRRFNREDSSGGKYEKALSQWANRPVLEQHPDITAELAQPDQKSNRSISEDRPGVINESELIGEYFIDNAGMVLLWPYLERFFRNLGWLNANDFIDDAARQRAILMLQYLATGANETPEYQLLLNKIICGWETDEPVAKSFAFSQQEKTEAENLLNAVIENWQALKRTSIGGLRQSFFQREGCLVQVEKNWLMRVDRKGMDVLLERLPWSIGIVKLPWMNNCLRVEW